MMTRLGLINMRLSDLIKKWNKLQEQYAPSAYAFREPDSSMIRFRSMRDESRGFELAVLGDGFYTLRESSEDYINEFTYDELQLLSQLSHHLKIYVLESTGYKNDSI